MPMGDIIRRSALRFPEKTALVFGPRRMTYHLHLILPNLDSSKNKVLDSRDCIDNESISL
jgi:hypothetical protein